MVRNGTGIPPKRAIAKRMSAPVKCWIMLLRLVPAVSSVMYFSTRSVALGCACRHCGSKKMHAVCGVSPHSAIQLDVGTSMALSRSRIVPAPIATATMLHRPIAAPHSPFSARNFSKSKGGDAAAPTPFVLFSLASISRRARVRYAACHSSRSLMILPRPRRKPSSSSAVVLGSAVSWRSSSSSLRRFLSRSTSALLGTQSPNWTSATTFSPAAESKPLIVTQALSDMMASGLIMLTTALSEIRAVACGHKTSSLERHTLSAEFIVEGGGGQESVGWLSQVHSSQVNIDLLA